MIHKILLFNLSDDAKAALIEQKAMELLPAVPGAKNVAFRRAIQEGDVHYHYMLTVDFDSMADHQAYLVHDKHVQFSKEIFRPNMSELLIQFFE